MRLCEWRLSEDGSAFVYGGDEVEMSLWDTEKAFSPVSGPASDSMSAEAKKRKRGDQLLPAEVWRAKNVGIMIRPTRLLLLTVFKVPNDHLSLRQAVQNTAFTFLQTSGSIAHQHILAGTSSGNVRRYDTRAGRRPVSDWKNIGQTGGVNTVERGFHEQYVKYAPSCNYLS